MRLRLSLPHKPSLCLKPVKTRNVKAATVEVVVTAPAATNHAVSPVARVAQKAVADALKPVKAPMHAVHAVAVADAVVAPTVQRKAKVNASVLTKRVVPWTPANQP